MSDCQIASSTLAIVADSCFRATLHTDFNVVAVIEERGIALTARGGGARVTHLLSWTEIAVWGPQRGFADAAVARLTQRAARAAKGRKA